MELAWLEDFIALDRTRNFTSAAQSRHTTQPAFSRRIQNLELWLDISLFNREDRPVTLTAAGEAFKPRAYRLRDDMMDTKRIVNLSATVIPDAKIIYTTNTIAVGLLPQWIKDQGLKNYRLVVSSYSTCIDAITHGRADSALIPHFPLLGESKLRGARIIAKDKLVFIRPDLVRIPTLLQNGILNCPTLMYSPKTAFGQVVAKFMNQKNLYLADDPVCESASAEALLAQVKNGLGAGWVVESLLDKTQNYGEHYKKFDIPYQILLLENFSKDKINT